MKFLKRFNAKHWQAGLNVAIAFGVFIMILMFISFNSKVAENTQATRKSTASTNQIVKQQGDILDAIKKLAIDNKLTSEQARNTIICMLQVPVEQRTTDLKEQCRKNAEAGQTFVVPVKDSLSPGKSTQTNQPSQNPQKKSTIKTISDSITNLIKGIHL